jgi:serine protease inhibitor
MRYSIRSLALLFCVTSVWHSAEAQPRGPRAGGRAATAEISPEVRALANANNQFAWDLYAQVCETNEVNLYFSPQSISITLAMTLEWGRGETASQMAKVLHLDSSQNTVPNTTRRKSAPTIPSCSSSATTPAAASCSPAA